MNRNDFMEIMENSAPVDSHRLGEIDEVIKIYPYFQTAHLLLLKGLHDNEDIKFSNSLRNSAVNIADREVLYHMLYSPVIKDSFIQNEDINPDSGQTVIESAKNSEEMISSIEKQYAEEIPEEKDEQIDRILIDNDDMPGNDRYDQNTVPESEGLLELDSDAMASGNNDSKAEPDPASQENNFLLSQADLIDRFIISNPRIEPIKDIKNVPVEDRSVSVFSEGVFVSETLARIYISQGYYSKAIDIFEKLSLKYPEKSSYFATQIEKVKELLK